MFGRKQMSGMPMNEQPNTFVESSVHHGTPGTSAEPDSTPMPMLMTMKGNWMLMFHGEAFLNVVQQRVSRGSTKCFRQTGLCRWHNSNLISELLPFARCSVWSRQRSRIAFTPRSHSKRSVEAIRLGWLCFSDSGPLEKSTEV